MRRKRTTTTCNHNNSTTAIATTSSVTTAIRDRRRFLGAVAGTAVAGILPGCRRSAAPGQRGTSGASAMTQTSSSSSSSATPSATSRMPVLFVGHGSPMNAIEDNRWSRGFRALAALLPRPKAIVAVSAHWFVPGTFVTDNAHPKTIHDFGGFPRALFEMQYPAPGDVELARRLVGMLGDRAALRSDWGLDHGTWSVLHHLVPDADCPVVQLSIDRRMPPAEHLALARALAPLRQQGILVMGSGNITHNLRYAMTSYQRGDESTPPWASTFDTDVARAAEQHDHDFLARAVESEAGRMSHPILDHYLPLLYAVGAADREDAVRFPISGFELGSLSMRSVIFG
jgi:4,5-DOPA dioxygenase extradiol